MSELPTFDAVKAIAKCGACGKELFPHSTPNICDYREDCPMHGEAWMQYQSARRMQNAYSGK